jgi:hypothetical protein
MPRAVLVLVVLGGALLPACSHAVNPVVLQDAQTAVRVKTALVNDAVLGVRPIEVSVANGVARLSGKVASEAERQRAADVARSVEGVRQVMLELTVETTIGETAAPLPAAPMPSGPDPLQGDELKVGDRRLLAVGLSFRQTYPADRELESSLGVGPLIRVGSGRGLGLDIGFGWFGADLSSGGTPAGRMHVRPVMAGLSYTLGSARISTSWSVVGGRAFNSLSEQSRAPGPVLALEVRDSFAWRPGVSTWIDASRRIAFNVSAHYLVTRPRVTWLDRGRTEERTLRGDAVTISTGVVYKLF